MASDQRKIVNVATRAIKASALCFIAIAAQQAHANPTDINSCVTITRPGSYVVVNDIAYGPASGACIQIMVGKVSLNLNGHTISWPASPHNIFSQPRAIVSANDAEHVTVRNGTISGFSSGVQLFGDGSTVEDIHVGGPCPCNGAGIEAIGVVKDNVVSIFSAPDGSVGIHAAGVVKGNYVYNTRSIGMQIDANSTVTGNTVTGTTIHPGYGMEVACPSTVDHNTVTGSEGKNIVLNGEGCTAKDNTAP